VDLRQGTLFTGGVEGVGADAYTGIMKYCIDELRTAKTGVKMPDDRFFVLVPAFNPPSMVNKVRLLGINRQSFPYIVPEVYQALGSLSERGKIDVVVAGNNMAERRGYLACVADALVVINGGTGTLDEAVMALQNGKPVITLSYSGGAALELKEHKDSSYPITLSTTNPEQAYALGKFSPDLIHVAEDPEEILRCLDQALDQHLLRF
jgi:hypothetical protein